MFRTIITTLYLLLALSLVMPSQAASHTVQKKETFYSISKKHGLTAKQLMQANGINDPTKLKIGTKLKIPGKSSKSSTAKKNKSVSLKSSTPPTRRGKTIIIDPGHGGRDPGAQRGGVNEATLNLQVAYKLSALLKAEGYRVVMTRYGNRTRSLSSRAAFANRYPNALFISIHFNATQKYYSSVRGTETFYAGRRGYQLARFIHPQMVKKCDLRDRRIRNKNFTVIKNTNCPAVLVECGYMSNLSELKRCKSSAFQHRIASAITSGILRYDGYH